MYAGLGLSTLGGFGGGGQLAMAHRAAGGPPHALSRGAATPPGPTGSLGCGADLPRLVVTGFPPDWGPIDLGRFFEQFGDVQDCDIEQGPHGPRGLVQLGRTQEVLRAYSSLSSMAPVRGVYRLTAVFEDRDPAAGQLPPAPLPPVPPPPAPVAARGDSAPGRQLPPAKRPRPDGGSGADGEDILASLLAARAGRAAAESTVHQQPAAPPSGRPAPQLPRDPAAVARLLAAAGGGPPGSPSPSAALLQGDRQEQLRRLLQQRQPSQSPPEPAARQPSGSGSEGSGDTLAALLQVLKSRASAADSAAAAAASEAAEGRQPARASAPTENAAAAPAAAGGGSAQALLDQLKDLLGRHGLPAAAEELARPPRTDTRPATAGAGRQPALLAALREAGARSGSGNGVPSLPPAERRPEGADAVYVVMRSPSHEVLARSVEHETWGASEGTAAFLNRLRRARTVLLIFAVDGSNYFTGYAEMRGQAVPRGEVSGRARQSLAGFPLQWDCLFPVQWLQVGSVDFADTQQVTTDTGKAAALARGGDLLDRASGVTLCNLIDEAQERTREEDLSLNPAGATGAAASSAGALDLTNLSYEDYVRLVQQQQRR
eukprot:TRINITY_DN424_c0_g1_i1.p1 TRINITY_DN424_c0_g1~~TRINITY_DN424_c0_g1_i1.p1  ORF type:complete len:602 (+),score=156.49 TRINITY_DN424_c0_g1_i1:99-1904(+)